MYEVQTGAGVSVGDLTLEIHTGESSHDIGLYRENVVFCTAQDIVTACSDRRGRSALIPVDRLHVFRGDLVCSCADDIKAGRQHQIGRGPVWRIACVVRVIHLGLRVIGADVPGQG